MAVSERDKEIYLQYIDRFGRPTKFATSLIAFAEKPEINKPISYEKARQIIKYFSIHPIDKSYRKQKKKIATARNKSQTTTTKKASSSAISQERPRSSSLNKQQKSFKLSTNTSVDHTSGNTLKKFANAPSSENDEKERENWKIGDTVQYFSTTKQKWFDGEIIDITNDDEGEWLNVRYGISEVYHTQIGRYSEDIRQTRNIPKKEVYHDHKKELTQKDSAFNKSDKDHSSKISSDQNEQKITDPLDANHDEKKAEELREKFFEENEDDEVPIRPIYYAVKRIDDKYKLIFKPECNHKGCCNKPDINPKLLKGDMYICKEHRIKIANELKEEHGNNWLLKDAISKLEMYDDIQYYEEGKELEDNDYFLQTYSKIQQQKLKIVHKLSSLDGKISPDYWAYMMQYKQLEEQSILLCNIRKISNPFLAILADIVIAAGTKAGIAVEITAGVTASITAGIEAIGVYFGERIVACQAAMEELRHKIFKSKNMKQECKMKIIEADAQINESDVNYSEEIENINKEMENEVQALIRLKGDIKDMKDDEEKAMTKIREQSNQLSFQQMEIRRIELQKQMLLNEYQTKREEMEREKMKHEEKMQILRNTRTEFKTAMELDESNWKRAVERAEYGSLRTAEKRISLHIVHDKRENFGWCHDNAYDILIKENWETYGNYIIFKFDARTSKGIFSDKYIRFSLKTNGKCGLWIHDLKHKRKKWQKDVNGWDHWYTFELTI